MIMTPEEASKVWCHRSTEPVSERFSQCIAHRCMAWRWAPSLTVNRPNGINEPRAQEVKKQRGYCGLAGKP